MSNGTNVIQATITQLRTYCAPLGGRVAAAANFADGLERYNATMGLPCGYVEPLDQDSDGNQVMTGLIQTITKRYGVVVEFDARNDRRGQDPAEAYEAMEAALFSTLLLWKPEDCRTINNQGYFFSAGRYLTLDRARLFYRWEFALNWQITTDDAWQDTGVPLVSIEVDVFKVPPQDMTKDQPAAKIIIDTLNATPIPQKEDA